MSDISTINGRSIFDYDDYAEGHSAAEQAAFEGSAKVPVAGKYDPSTDTVETKTVALSDLLSGGGGGGGGGLSPITPTTITPTLENETYKIVIPSNNAYYIATINEAYNVEITPPTIGANEMYNIVLFVIYNEFSDITMTMAYDDYGIAPMDDETKYGNVYGHGFTQFIFLGKGCTMKTSAYSYG